MNTAPELPQIPVLPPEIVEAGPNGELVLFVGAGISRLAGLPSWRELAQNSLELLRKAEILNYSTIDQLRSVEDPKTLLSIARIMADEEEFPLDIASLLSAGKQCAIYDLINQIGCACVTTNYDELLAPTFKETDDAATTSTSVKPKPIVRVCERSAFLPQILDEPGTVVHLHGSVSNPATMVLTTTDYLEHYNNKDVQYFLATLFETKTVLFLGYGLAEAEVLEYVLRKGAAGKRADRRRFALQGYFGSQRDLHARLHAYYRKSFGVHILGFQRDLNDYGQQEDILRLWSPQIRIDKPPLVNDLQIMNQVLGSE